MPLLRQSMVSPRPDAQLSPTMHNPARARVPHLAVPCLKDDVLIGSIVIFGRKSCRLPTTDSRWCRFAAHPFIASRMPACLKNSRIPTAADGNRRHAECHQPLDVRSAGGAHRSLETAARLAARSGCHPARRGRRYHHVASYASPLSRGVHERACAQPIAVRHRRVYSKARSFHVMDTKADAEMRLTVGPGFARRAHSPRRADFARGTPTGVLILTRST